MKMEIKHFMDTSSMNNNTPPIVSIIVPVYNAEKYLPRCIESILSQTFTNFELVLINDGSYDKSLEICNQYATKDSRIRVLNKNNGGVSSARNLGLKNASGEWVAFIDSDDEVLSDYIEDLFVYNKQDINIIVGNCKVIQNGCKIKNHVDSEHCIMTCQLFLEKLLCGNNVRNEVWGKLFRKSFLNGLLFDENIKIGEDLLFVMNSCLQNPSSKIVVIPTEEYIYHQVLGSAMINSNDLSADYEKLINQVLENFQGIINRSILSRFILNQYWVILNRYKFKRWQFTYKYDNKIKVEYNYVINHNEHDRILYWYTKNHIIGYVIYLLNKIYKKIK